MARRWIGPVRSLGEAVAARRLLWVLCLECGRAARFRPIELEVMLGRDLSLEALKDRLTCRHCRRRRAAVVVDDQPLPGRD